MNILIHTVISSSLYKFVFLPDIHVAGFFTSRKQDHNVHHAIPQAKLGDDILSHIHPTGVRIVLQLYLACGAAVPGDSDFFLNQVTELVVKG